MRGELCPKKNILVKLFDQSETDWGEHPRLRIRKSTRKGRGRVHVGFRLVQRQVRARIFDYVIMKIYSMGKRGRESARMYQEHGGGCVSVWVLNIKEKVGAPLCMCFSISEGRGRRGLQRDESGGG